MIFKQFYLACLSHASYFIADEKAGVAAVVDPQRDIDEYLEMADKHHCTITHVFLTHFHADFLAGHLELQKATGAKIYLGQKGQAEYETVPLKDGDILSLGEVKIEVLETPGHTPEGVCLKVNDKALLTGDTLFVGDVGRPDLLSSKGMTAEELAGMMFDSLHDKILPLPDTLTVYPAHGPGSACGRALGSETFSSLGTQKENNYALQPMSREDFIRLLTEERSPAPRYFAYDATLNKKSRLMLSDMLAKSLKPLSLEEVLSQQSQGVVVLDVRHKDDFASGHLKGSLNLGLDGRFASWVGTLIDPEQPIIVIADTGDEKEALTRLGRIGYDSILGYLEGGFEFVKDRNDLVAVVPRLTVEALREQLPQQKLTVLDVRGAGEWEAGHIEGSVNLPLETLEDNIEKCPQGPIVIHCASGYRSMTAASILKKHGREDLYDLENGYEAWAGTTACSLK